MHIRIFIVPILIALVLGVPNPVRSHIAREWALASLRSRTVTLNTFMPSSFSYLVRFQINPAETTTYRIIEFVRYSRKITEYIPDLPEAYVILGFCEYYLGEPDRAIASFEKAVALNPYFIWAHYNLGVIYLERGEYRQAVDRFMTVIGLPEAMTLRVMELSKVYNDLLNQQDMIIPRLPARLQGAKIRSYRYIAEALAAVGEKESAAEFLKIAAEGKKRAGLYWNVDEAKLHIF